MEETKIVLRNHRASVLSETCHFQGCPDGVAGEELVVGRNPGELDHTEFHDKVVNQLLGLFLCERSRLQISFDVDIQEGGNPSDGHGCTVLRLYGGKVAEIEPLDCLFRVFGGTTDIKTVAGCHFLHFLKGTNLIGNFLSSADDFIGHGTVTEVCKVFLFLFYQEVNSVKGDSSVIPHDPSSSVRIGKTGENLIVSRLHHFRGVCVKNTLIMGFVIFGENLMQFGVRRVAVGRAGLFSHFDTAVRHESTFQRFIRL